MAPLVVVGGEWGRGGSGGCFGGGCISGGRRGEDLLMVGVLVMGVEGSVF